MTIAVGVVLTVLAFAFIAYPFFRQRLRSADSGDVEKIRELYSKRDTAYSMLKEIELDFQSGILTEEDYLDLETRYKRKAIAILKDIDNLEKGAEIENEIEKQVIELRRSKGQHCPQCRVKYKEDARFCSHCGANLSQEEQSG